MQLLAETIRSPFEVAISPLLELGAFEALWAENKASFKTIANKFAQDSNALPSYFVPKSTAEKYAEKTLNILKKANIQDFGIQIHKNYEYPDKLREAQYPSELLYYQGWWDLISSKKSVAIVGTRQPTKEGISRTKSLVRQLVSDGVTIISGLAKGIDTTAHETCIEEKGRTIAVLGTPISRSYPKTNASLQNQIASDHLLISQVPVCRYEQAPNPTVNRFFFPQRNIMMSAISDATVIVEAGNTSGTLIQAKAAISQGRKLFIMNSCFENQSISWPEKFQKLGAIRLRSYDDIKQHVIS